MNVDFIYLYTVPCMVFFSVVRSSGITTRTQYGWCTVILYDAIDPTHCLFKNLLGLYDIIQQSLFICVIRTFLFHYHDYVSFEHHSVTVNPYTDVKSKYLYTFGFEWRYLKLSTFSIHFIPNCHPLLEITDIPVNFWCHNRKVLMTQMKSDCWIMSYKPSRFLNRQWVGSIASYNITVHATGSLFGMSVISSNGWQLGMKCIENVESFRYLHSKPKIKIFGCLILKIISSITSKTESIVKWTLNIVTKNCDTCTCIQMYTNTWILHQYMD
jgi:hypothetical protein